MCCRKEGRNGGAGRRVVFPTWVARSARGLGGYIVRLCAGFSSRREKMDEKSRRACRL